jgi:hypothetical protein
MTQRAYSPSLGKWVEVVPVETPGAPAAKPKRPKGHGFVMVPNMWRLRLREVNADGTTYHVAMVILDKSRWAEWVPLSNGAVGIDRHAKYDALKQLREAGLVLVEEQKGKSPRVKALFRKE